MDSQYDEPYRLPTAYLPANSKLLPANEFHLYILENPAIRLAVLDIASLMRHINTLLSSDLLISAAELTDWILGLRDTLYAAYTLLEPSYVEMEASETYETSKKATTEALTKKETGLLKGYNIYDKYFQVIRVPRMPSYQLICQAIVTFDTILADLPFAIMARDEVTAIVDATQTMFEHLAGLSPSEISETAMSWIEPSKEIGEQDKLWSAAWSQSREDLESRSKKIAMFRWVVGHHLFDLFTICCTDNLLQAQTQFGNGNEFQGIEHLKKAQRLLRGTTASMWYAANFPGTVYQKHIRPTMKDQETPEGFSGEQNADYNRLKSAKESLKQTLYQVYGTQLNNWPPTLSKAIREFVEIDTLDCEHHVLIAASMTGLEASLSQEVWQSEIPDEVKKLNATDLLREMARLRRIEFESTN